MKWMKITLLVFFFSAYINSQAQSITGKWFLIEEGDTAKLELSKDSIFHLIFKKTGTNLGGLYTYSPEESEDDDSVFIDHKYTCKLNIFPHQLVLTGYYANTDSVSFIIPTYFEFWEDGSLVLFLHEDGILDFEDGNPKKLIEEFYKSAVIKKENYEEALIFKPTK